ncbi:putative nicotinate phosphoribosyltransferase [compost metagenome]
MEYYGEKGFVAASVPATEHAVATSNILGIQERFAAKSEGNHISRLLAEKAFMKDLITRKFPKGIVSYVADSFDFWAVLTEILPDLKEVIMARESNGITPGKLVIRPDSGDPVKVICGMSPVVGVDRKAVDFQTVEEVHEAIQDRAYNFDGVDCVKIDGKFYPLTVKDGYTALGYTEIPYEVVAGAVRTLWKTFGGTTTSKGYKLLDEHIGLIYGDSITPQRCLEILERLEAQGFASGNVVFGIGSYTYQMSSRDTFGFAVKATYTVVNGKGIAIFKDPKTDSKKKSAKGLLFVGRNSEAGYYLEDDVSPEEEASEENLLKLLFLDGVFLRRTTLTEIRERLGTI